MKCAIMRCAREADPPYKCCDAKHGWWFKQIKEAMLEGRTYYYPYRLMFTKWLTEEEVEYYSKLLNLYAKNPSNVPDNPKSGPVQNGQ